MMHRCVGAETKHIFGIHTQINYQVCTYLTSKSWETRIAAGQAVEAIARNVKKWQPTYQPRLEGDGGRASPTASDTDYLSFEFFDIHQVS